MTIPSDLKVVVAQEVSESVKKLIWQVFFVSRARGINLSVHFPWLDGKDVFCIKISHPKKMKEKVIAALVVKKVAITEGEIVGLVGLVCVAEDWRGKKLSSLLMAEVTNAGKSMSLDGLVLWTQKPEVYSGHGYISDRQEMFGYVQNSKYQKLKIRFSSQIWPDSYALKSHQGLPPFANSGRIISTDFASVIVFDGHDGRITLGEWEGKIGDVADLLESAMPDKWWINIAAGDELIVELQNRELEVNLEPAAVRMVKNLKNLSIPQLNNIKFLDRV